MKEDKVKFTMEVDGQKYFMEISAEVDPKTPIASWARVVAYPMDIFVQILLKKSGKVLTEKYEDIISKIKV